MTSATSSKFILSRATADVVLTALKKHTSRMQQKEVLAPCDFKLRKLKFQIIGLDRVEYNSKPIPLEVLETALEKNIAYEVVDPTSSSASRFKFQYPKQQSEHGDNNNNNDSAANTNNDDNKSENDANSSPMLLHIEPLIFDRTAIAKAKSNPASAIYQNGEDIFKLTEPLETDVVGPILSIGHMKMHLSKDYKTTYEFSQRLAQAIAPSIARNPNNHTCLDLFFGQGFSLKETLHLGSKRIVTFEKHKEVIELARKNPFSLNPDVFPRHNIQLINADIEKHLWEHLAQLSSSSSGKGGRKGGDGPIQFDACILDPPKRPVMSMVFSQDFIRRLSQEHMRRPGSLVAAYVPEDGTNKTMKDALKNIVQTFQEAGNFKFRGNFKNDPRIYVFEKM